MGAISLASTRPRAQGGAISLVSYTISLVIYAISLGSGEVGRHFTSPPPEISGAISLVTCFTTPDHHCTTPATQERKIHTSMP